MKKIQITCIALFTFGSLIVNISKDPQGRIKLVNTAAATVQTYQPTVVQCVYNGEPVGTAIICEDGMFASCKVDPCNF
jgi:hypothetical protein